VESLTGYPSKQISGVGGNHLLARRGFEDRQNAPGCTWVEVRFGFFKGEYWRAQFVILLL
jgi:hypothetical protein